MGRERRAGNSDSRKKKKEGKSFLVRPISFIAQPGGHRRDTVHNGSAPLQRPDYYYFSCTVSSVTISTNARRRLHQHLLHRRKLLAVCTMDGFRSHNCTVLGACKKCEPHLSRRRSQCNPRRGTFVAMSGGSLSPSVIYLSS